MAKENTRIYWVMESFEQQKAQLIRLESKTLRGYQHKRDGWDGGSVTFRTVWCMSSCGEVSLTAKEKSFHSFDQLLQCGAWQVLSRLVDESRLTNV